MLQNMDKQQVTLLVMLNLSGAFDTTDHTIMLENLSNEYGVKDKALSWFRSYLADRTQQALYNGEMSSLSKLRFSVPQGFCLGPIMFNLYAVPLFRFILGHLICAHGYAADHQHYTLFSTGCDVNQADAIKQTQDCISDIRLIRLTLTNPK